MKKFDYLVTDNRIKMVEYRVLKKKIYMRYRDINPEEKYEKNKETTNKTQKTSIRD